MQFTYRHLFFGITDLSHCRERIWTRELQSVIEMFPSRKEQCFR